MLPNVTSVSYLQRSRSPSSSAQRQLDEADLFMDLIKDVANELDIDVLCHKVNYVIIIIVVNSLVLFDTSFRLRVRVKIKKKLNCVPMCSLKTLRLWQNSSRSDHPFRLQI